MEFFALFSAFVARRPYFAEDTGALIVSTDASLEGVVGLSVTATLASPTLTLLANETMIGSTRARRLPFSLASLPPMVRTTMTITLHFPPGHRQDIVKTRWFERVSGALPCSCHYLLAFPARF